MSTVIAREPGVAIARRSTRTLLEALGLPVLDVTRPGAVGLLPRPVLLRAADGWVHPGPPTVWPEFEAMLASLGGDLSVLPAEVVDAEAGVWMLPAVAVRSTPAPPPSVRWPRAITRVNGARVVVLGATWAAPLTGFVLAALGASVVRVTDPRRVDPFPLRDALMRGVEDVPLDLGSPRGAEGFTRLLRETDLLVDGTTPRVLANIGLSDTPAPIVRIAAFADEDRPGYGIAAECRGGWAARYDPPRVGRVSVADPVAGLLATLVAVDVLTSGHRGARERVSLEDAVGYLFTVEGHVRGVQ